jgi:hypothetical protein
MLRKAVILTGETSMVRNGRGRPVAVLALLAVALLAGCGGGDGGDLPEPGTRSGASAVSPTASSTASSGLGAEEQAVADRVELYYETVDAIAAGENVDMAKLRAVAVAAWAQLLGRNLQQTKALGFVVSGEVERTVKAVRVDGATAEYVHCIDQRGTRMVKNGKPEPDGPLQTDPPTLASLTLVRESGVWKVRDGKARGTC